MSIQTNIYILLLSHIPTFILMVENLMNVKFDETYVHNLVHLDQMSKLSYYSGNLRLVNQNEIKILIGISVIILFS